MADDTETTDVLVNEQGNPEIESKEETDKGDELVDSMESEPTEDPVQEVDEQQTGEPDQEVESEQTRDPDEEMKEADAIEVKVQPEEDEEEEKEEKETKPQTPPPPPELAKYWKVVKDNCSDFTGWTYLLQYVEQENHLGAAREAFNAFFDRYPYCYGYWKKFADLEKKFGNLDRACEVFERGTRGIALSIDLWMNYITFYMDNFDKESNYEDNVRSLFEKSIAAAGTEFRSDKLWDMYINWEKDHKNFKRVTALYDRLLAIPTQLYSHHFDQFKEHINGHTPRDVLTTDEFLQIRADVVASMGSGEPDDDAPPGVDAPPGLEDPEVAPNKVDPETGPIREKIIEIRKNVFRQTEEEVSKRWAYEEGVKRPYFHVKPLERAQLKNWREYLDFEIENGSHERVVVLFERCMIACALYEDFWLKYAKYLEPHSKVCTSSVFRRACDIHLPKKPNIHLQWAAYEEQQGNVEVAREVLKKLDQNVPGLAMISLRRVGLERREKNYSTVQELLTECISKAKNSAGRSFYAIKLARFHAKVEHDLEKAKEVVNSTLEKDKTNSKLYLQLLDLEFQENQPNEERITDLFERVLNSKDISQETKVLFSQRKLEFLEDYGSDVSKLLTAYEEHQKISKQHSSSKKRSHGNGDDGGQEKKTKYNGNQAESQASYNYSAASWSGYNSSNAYNYQHPPWNAYGQGYYPS